MCYKNHVADGDSQVLPDKVTEILKTFSKRQRIALRQRYGSRPILHIRHDADGYVEIQFGVDNMRIQKSFWIRPTGKIVYEKTHTVLRDIS